MEYGDGIHVNEAVKMAFLWLKSSLQNRHTHRTLTTTKKTSELQGKGLPGSVREDYQKLWPPPWISCGALYTGGFPSFDVLLLLDLPRPWFRPRLDHVGCLGPFFLSSLIHAA